MLYKASQWATYNGECRESVGEVMGPNTMGEYLTVVEALYDPDSNTTRLGFSYGTQEAPPNA